jgi:GT2 family glycosyltransferase
VAIPFSIVVVTWNARTLLGGLLDSAAEQLDGQHEFVFVDNGSNDGTLELLRGRVPRGDQVIALGNNRGFGAAANIGTAAAQGKVVVLLNPDCVLIDRSLSNLADLALSTGAVCGPRLLNQDGTPQSSAFARYASWETPLLALWPAKLMPRALVRRCDPWRLDERIEVGWISAGCLAARRELLLKLGPFDERLPHYGEDTDLCIRARRAGAAVVFAPDTARVIHLGGQSASKAFHDRGARRQMAARVWIARHRFGRLRSTVAIVGLLLEHLTRFAAKRVVGRDADWDRASVGGWIDTTLRRRAGGQLPSSEGL